MDKLFRCAEGLNRRFPDGDDPFKIVTRLAEECGEVAAEVNHFEDTGVKVARRGAPDRKAFAKELIDTMRVVAQLALYYDLREELEARLEESYQAMLSEGLIEPLAPGR
ncbi:MazG-like family protein [Candidatus Latescibacterota bacterium]